MDTREAAASHERVVAVKNGWIMLVLLMGLLLADVAMIGFAMLQGVLLVLSCAVLAICVILLKGFFSLQPNEARVLLLFGAYRGTVRESGLHWGNPFYTNGPQFGMQAMGLQNRLPGATRPDSATATRRALGRNKISLRARTLNGERLKVNDKRGNPIEIAAVVVWRVDETAQAMFDVDDYENYIRLRANRRCGTWPACTRTMTAREAKPRSGATSRRSRGHCVPNCRSGSRRPAWWSMRRASHIWPTRPKSPR